MRSRDDTNIDEIDDNILDGVTYSQLRRAVINKYHASDPETHDLKEEFMESLNAFHLVEKDGLPTPINGVQGEGLYVGSIGTYY